ncbi:putative bifunctional diguanylate cyclase/phosphodiesterase [Chelatococcus sp. GCM10030263]|uniref:putative bifunctional diguanylate cyclase/phosphodiesterase n=1 Tax=Chelatococcus sp. GCM10030263 TaxID=3273387 RepID=UPI003605F28D
MLLPGFRITRPAALIGRLIWPVALVVAVLFAVMVMTLTWMGQSVDEWFVAEQRNRLMVILASRQKVAEAQLAAIARSVDLTTLGASPQSLQVLRATETPRGTEPGTVDSLALLSAEGTVIAGILPGAVATAADIEARQPLFTNFVAGSPVRDNPLDYYVYHRDALYLLVPQTLAGTSSPAPARIAVLVYRFSPADIEALARQAGGGDLTIVQGKVALQKGTLPLKTTMTQPAAFIWSPATLPSSAVWPRLTGFLAAAAILTLLAVAVIFIITRRLANEVVRRQELAQRLAGQDPLSGLPNRLSFGMRLDQELARSGRSGVGLAVLFLDLDRFKEVNDTYGHAAGDNLIRIVAQRLADLLRGADTLARFGGDEFAVIQTGVNHHHEAEALARRILDSVKKPMEIAGTTVSVGASIGIVLSPHNGRDRETLLRLADTALYQAKNGGRNRFSFFERQMDEALRLRKVVEDDLRQAIENNELVLHYQPQVEIDSYSIVAVEALVRWPHREHGLIAPEKFIAVAEERGLIIPLGEWVLRQACHEAKRWPNLRIAVNVSPIQFRHRDFVASVMRIINESGIDPTRVELELTEGVVVEDADAAEDAMIELRAHGVRLALDDFGTGYSSLIYLRRFAFDKIKIDRSFLEAAETTGESAILIHSIVHLGRALGLTVTAEGVETQEQLEFLRALGCHELQGYLFSRPVPAEAIDAMLEAPTAGHLPARAG